jgi:hypothetical protein
MWMRVFRYSIKQKTAEMLIFCFIFTNLQQPPYSSQ